MKQKLITRLVIGAIAGLAASSAAYAGQIQSSSISIAREVIPSDTYQLDAPAASYRFAGDVDARLQTQTFQVQLQLLDSAGLGSPQWVATANAASIVVTDGVTGTVWTQSAVAGAQTYQIVGTPKVGKTIKDNDTLYVTIQVDTMAVGKDLLKQPIITFNGAGVVAQIKNLKTIVGDVVACDTAVKKMAMQFYHFNGLSDPGIMATEQNASKDEHNRVNSQNTGTLITFPTNINVAVGASTYQAVLSSGGNLKFADSGAAGTSWVSATLANLGNFNLVQQATGNDADATNPYSISKVAANGLKGIDPAAQKLGEVETKQIKVSLKASKGFVNGGSVFLDKAANCGTPIAGSTVALTAADSVAERVVDVPLTFGAINTGVLTATGAGKVYVCYQVPGTTMIPSSGFSAVVTVDKAPAGVHNEQNNSCNGTMYSLAGGIKIDVRNYASSAEKAASGWQSVVRFINNSDTRTTDVWGQIIHQDGKLGGYGQITTLAPRQVVNMTSTEIDAKLTTPANAGAANNGPTAPVALATGAPRLRVTSEAGDTLRVQNYVVSPTGQMFEASNSQAVDFEQGANRAPASDGQFISQDAQSGLNLAR